MSIAFEKLSIDRITHPFPSGQGREGVDRERAGGESVGATAADCRHPAGEEEGGATDLELRWTGEEPEGAPLPVSGGSWQTEGAARD